MCPQDALLALGGVVGTERQGRVPVLDATYRVCPDGGARAAQTRAGASGSGMDRLAAYAARLEFGGGPGSESTS